MAGARLAAIVAAIAGAGIIAGVLLATGLADAPGGETGPAEPPPVQGTGPAGDSETGNHTRTDPVPAETAPEEEETGVIEITSSEQLVELVESTYVAEPHAQFQSRWGAADDVAQFAITEPDRAFIMESGSAPVEEAELALESRTDHSATNVQVAGVDEPDYLKNDGQYAYVMAGNMLIIVDVWPAPDMHTVTRVALDIEPYRVHDMFLNSNNDEIVVFYTADDEELVIREYGFEPQHTYKPVTRAVIIDVSDRESPAIRADYSIDGWFNDARMIGDHVYAVTTSHISDNYPRLPIITESGGGWTATPRVLYFEGSGMPSSFTTLAAIDLAADNSSNGIVSETYLMGHTGTYYVTHSNFYLTHSKSLPPVHDHRQAERDRFFNAIVPLLPAHVQEQIMEVEQAGWTVSSYGHWEAMGSILQDHYDSLDGDELDALFERMQEAIASYEHDVMRKQIKTVIHKVAIDGNDIKYQARGEVPGRLLNQFSLGESGGGDRLRVATTLEYHTGFSGIMRSNGVYALDEDLKVVGALEDVAPDERIYSARFMGERLYMVTFQQVDPFFVIDIAGDTPRILGELKIPGFSNYLHPYDDEHVIGVGRDTKLEDERWVRQLGLKIALFNVTDVSDPTVADEIIIGDRSTHSDALWDHKAFFFDGRHSMISMPVSGPYHELAGTLDPPERSNVFRDDGYGRGQYWSGFYILDVDPQDGIDSRGAIAHSKAGTESHGHVDPRTFYIEDVLYTAADGVLIASDIGSLEQVGFVRLTGTGGLVEYME